MLHAKPSEQFRDHALLRRAAEWSANLALADLTPERLLAISREHDSDFATAIAYQTLRRDPANKEAIRAIEQLWSEPTFPQVQKKASFALIPNVGYSLDEVSRAAGDQILAAAAQFGFETFVIPTQTSGTLASNALIICETLRQRRDDIIVLASISKGSADLKAAFARKDAEVTFSRVAAWINFCGLLDGMPLVNLTLERDDPNMRAQIVEWFGKYGDRSVLDTLESLRECGRGPGRPLGEPLLLPPQILPVHVVGFPRKRDFFFAHAKIFHELTLEFGPNDGFALISDLINKPGLIFPVWRSDHYIDRVIDAGRLSAAIIAAVCRWIDITESDLPAPQAV